MAPKRKAAQAKAPEERQEAQQEEKKPKKAKEEKQTAAGKATAALPAAAAKAGALKVGDLVPDVKLENQEGAEVSLRVSAAARRGQASSDFSSCPRGIGLAVEKGKLRCFACTPVVPAAGPVQREGRGYLHVPQGEEECWAGCERW